jgi:hypothetical protein
MPPSGKMNSPLQGNQNTIDFNGLLLWALRDGGRSLPNRRQGVNQTCRQFASPGPTECSSALARAEFRRIPGLLCLDFSTAKGRQEVLLLAEPYCPARARSTEVITGWMAQPLDANRRVEVDEALEEVLPLTF